MRPNSQLLESLNREVHLLERINFTSIWTPLDAMIVPSISSNLSVGKNICLWVPTHAQMITDNKCLQVVNEVLSEPRRQLSKQKIRE
jgi:triacylglycerol lipase